MRKVPLVIALLFLASGIGALVFGAGGPGLAQTVIGVIFLGIARKYR